MTLPTQADPGLACAETTGPGHLSTIRLATALRRWVDAIPALRSDLPGPDGAPLPFDRSRIYPYAFRHSYARTLRLWAERFTERWDEIKKLGYSEAFRRKWLYYLSYCEAGFLEGTIDVGIYQYRKPA